MRLLVPGETEEKSEEVTPGNLVDEDERAAVILSAKLSRC